MNVSFKMRVLALLFIAFTISSNAVLGARILCIFPTPSVSHHFFHQQISRVLALRGHQVVVATTNPQNDKSLANLTEVDITKLYDVLSKSSLVEIMAKEKGIFNVFRLTMDIGYVIEKELIEEVLEFRAVIENKNEHFDLIVLEGFYPVLYGLAYKFKAPIIAALPFETPVILNDYYGVPNHPIIYPCHMSMFEGEWTISKKIKSVAFTLYQKLLFEFYVLPRADKLSREHFGNDMPYIGSLMKNISAVFVNRNFVFNIPRALTPNYVELNQMHIKPVQPLPKDLQELMDNADEGIIYFSLGTNVQSSKLAPQIRKTITEALNELPYKVLWKFETDDLTDVPKNVITRKWFPQQDVLGHPNVKAFLTQGGIQSLEEAVSRGVPVIGLPFMGDQHLNIHRVVQQGLGLWADPTSVTKEELKKLIIEVAENKQYRDKTMKMKGLLLDQPMNSTEKIIWWTEFVLRHKGATHLRSAVLDASFVEYYLIDVIVTVLLIPLLVIYSVVHFLKRK